MNRTKIHKCKDCKYLKKYKHSNSLSLCLKGHKKPIHNNEKIYCNDFEER